MFKINKFEVKGNHIILYPDYGNLKGFTIIGILAILFVWALYSVNATHHNIGDRNMAYIIIVTILFLIYGFLTAFKQVIFDGDTQTVYSNYFGLFKKTVASFNEILKLEGRYSNVPSAFYIVLKINPIGNGERISGSYSQFQQTNYSAFGNQILPMLNNLLLESATGADEERIDKVVTLINFKLTTNHTYRYISFLSVFFSVLSFGLALFMFVCAWIIIDIPIWVRILLIIFGLFSLFWSFASTPVTSIDTKDEILTQSSLFSWAKIEYRFAEIQNVKVVKHFLNGIQTYTSLAIITEKTPVTIDKSFSTAQISNVWTDLKYLLKLND